MKFKHLLSIVIILGLVLPQVNGATQANSSLPAPTAGFSISGKVTDGSGNGVEGATIVAVLDYYHIFIPQIRSNNAGLSTISNSPGDGQNFYTIQTDANGNYNLPLPPGRYTLSAEKVGIDLNPVSYTLNSSAVGGNYDFQGITIPTVYNRAPEICQQHRPHN
jgi:hypothetical protein